MKLCWEVTGSEVMCEGSPYNGLYTRIDHYMLLPIVLHMVVSLYWK